MDAVELLRWAIRYRHRELGVFHAGYGIGKEPGDVWHCHGCAGELCSNSSHVRFQWDDYGTVRGFPHADDCKYVTACKICEIKPLN